MKPTVGLIGLGLMGKPMGRNLLKAGFPLVVWNRTAAKAEDLVRDGAKLAANPRDVASQADVLITIVSDPPALEEVLWGKGDALAALRPGSTLIDSGARSLPRSPVVRLPVACAERGRGSFSMRTGRHRQWHVGSRKRRTRLHDRWKGRSAGTRQAGAGSARQKVFPAWAPTAVAGQIVKLAMNMLLALQVDALAESLALVTLRLAFQANN